MAVRVYKQDAAELLRRLAAPPRATADTEIGGVPSGPDGFAGLQQAGGRLSGTQSCGLGRQALKKQTAQSMTWQARLWAITPHQVPKGLTRVGLCTTRDCSISPT